MRPGVSVVRATSVLFVRVHNHHQQTKASSDGRRTCRSNHLDLKSVSLFDIVPCLVSRLLLYLAGSLGTAVMSLSSPWRIRPRFGERGWKLRSHDARLDDSGITDLEHRNLFQECECPNYIARKWCGWSSALLLLSPPRQS